jgi:hypothetical protein
MTVRTQIALDAEDHRRAKQRAAELNGAPLESSLQQTNQPARQQPRPQTTQITTTTSPSNGTTTNEATTTNETTTTTPAATTTNGVTVTTPQPTATVTTP